ncbi:MAG: hypothetical protein ACXQTF_01865, partial [Candidatus Hecatellaceae archaeon]
YLAKQHNMSIPKLIYLSLQTSSLTQLTGKNLKKKGETSGISLNQEILRASPLASEPEVRGSNPFEPAKSTTGRKIEI